MLPGPLRHSRSGLYVPSAPTGGGSTPAFKAFSGHQFASANESGIALPATASSGDLLVLLYVGNPSVTPVFTLTGSANVVTQISLDNWDTTGGAPALGQVVYAKVLGSSDITSGVLSVTGADTWGTGVGMFLYSGGATTVTRKSFATAIAGSPLVATGYAQSAGLAVALVGVRDNVGTAYTVSPPSPFVTDAQHSGFDGKVLDFDFIAAQAFHATSDITAISYSFTGYPSDPGGEAVTLVEIS